MKTAVIASAAAALALAGCSTSSEPTSVESTPTQQCSVVAAFYPLQYAAEQVGGDAANVIALTAPGVEPHDLELTPSQVGDISKADIVLYIPGFQPAVDTAIAQQAPGKGVDVTQGITLLNAPEGGSHSDDHGHSDDGHADEGQSDATTVNDPHVWLNPNNMATIGQTIQKSMATCAPDASDAISERTSNFSTQMTALANEATTRLANCSIKDMVVSHEAFGYLAQLVGLTQIPISGLSPDAEPSPARLAELADEVRNNGVTTIYFETLVSPSVAETLANETGTTTAVLDPLEGLTPGSDGNYDSIMKTNIETLATGQKCG